VVKRKGPTRDERRDAWVRAGGSADWSVLAPAFADETFEQSYEHALRLLAGEDEVAYTASLDELVALLHGFVGPDAWDRADKLLAVRLTYDVERRAGRSEAEALATAMSFRPRRYPISADNPAEHDLRGDMRLPLNLTRQQRAEAGKYFDDVLAEQPQLGRPFGSRSYGPDEWAKAWLEHDAEFQRIGTNPTDEQRADAMSIPRTTFKRYKRDYGVPHR